MPLRVAEEDYIKLIYKLRGDHQRVTLRMVAEKLEISAPAVTKMVRKLQEKELVHFDRREGVRLTVSGKAAALEVIRSHRLIELFLHKYLGYSWDEVHDEAEHLEHVVSDRFKERIFKLMDNPTHDPHGDPIPDVNLNVAKTSEISMADADPGYHGVISRVSDEDAEVLKQLAKLDMYPGSPLELVSVDGDGEARVILANGEEASLPHHLTRYIVLTEKGHAK